MHTPKAAMLCYGLAVFFIFAVAFYSSTKLLVAADALAPAASSAK
jgi:membrane protein YqaA with SNARE-associated domain